MKRMLTVLTMLTMLLVLHSPALAVDTTQTYQSGILVLIFLGVLALILVAQMVPALILLFGAMSAFAKKLGRRKAVVTVSEQDLGQ